MAGRAHLQKREHSEDNLCKWNPTKLPSWPHSHSLQHLISSGAVSSSAGGGWGWLWDTALVKVAQEGGREKINRELSNAGNGQNKQRVTYFTSAEVTWNAWLGVFWYWFVWVFLVIYGPVLLAALNNKKRGFSELQLCIDVWGLLAHKACTYPHANEPYCKAARSQKYWHSKGQKPPTWWHYGKDTCWRTQICPFRYCARWLVWAIQLLFKVSYCRK